MIAYFVFLLLFCFASHASTYTPVHMHVPLSLALTPLVLSCFLLFGAQACVATIALFEEQVKLISSCLDGDNLPIMLDEVCTRFYKCVCV